MVLMKFCKVCGIVTPHKEDPVPDKESATVWHCMYCGAEIKPDEPGGAVEGCLV